MRPPGDVALALATAARERGTVRQLCERAQVGFDVGRKTASRMVQRGDLRVLEIAAAAGPGRPPAVVVSVDRVRANRGVFELPRSFWEMPVDPDRA